MCAWSGGNFTRANPTWVSDATNLIGIEPVRHDNQDNDFKDGINECLNKTGQNGMTGTLSMGSNKITNLTAGTLRNDAAQVGQVQDGTSSYLGTTAGTSTAFTVTATPTITALVTGAQYSFKANAANGVAATLKIDGTTATTMQRQGVALVGNEFIANDFVTVVYDGTNFQIINVATAPLYVDRTNNRVGIGTTTPTSALQVTGAIDGIPDAEGVHIGMVSTTYACVELCGSTGGIVDFNSAGVDNKGRIIYTNSDNVMAFATNGAERTRINATGEVLVETTSSINAVYKLQVGNATGGKLIAVSGGNSATNDGSGIGFFTSTTNIGLIGNYSAVQGGAFDNRFTIKNLSTNLTVLGINAAVGTHFMKWSNATGNWTYDTSSARYKDNIEDSSYGLAEVLAMRPVTFTYKAEPERHDVGFIAEEMVNVIPEVVAKTTEGEPDAISYDRLTSVLCKAIQELNAKVEALEARIAALEA